MFVSGTRKVYLKPDGQVAYSVELNEVLKNPDGTEKTHRPLVQTEANVSSEVPVKWTGKMIPKDRAAKMFVFTENYQIKHVNGLAYDFLYEMAKKLSDAGALMLMGGGEKGTSPLVLSRGGVPYRGFLEGRVDGSKYCLILHLTNLELKEFYKTC